MSEIPHPNKPSDLERIAHFLNGYLGPELLKDIDYPKHLEKDYGDMTLEEQYELFEFTFNDLFRDSAMFIVDHMHRALSIVELNLIKRRILNYLKDKGMKYKK